MSIATVLASPSARANEDTLKGDLTARYAAMKDEENTLKYLELAFKNGYNDFLYVQGDKDFDFVRTNPAYPALIKKYNVK